MIVILGMMVVMVLQREPHIIDTFLISKSTFEVYFMDLKVILTWYFSLRSKDFERKIIVWVSNKQATSK